MNALKTPFPKTFDAGLPAVDETSLSAGHASAARAGARDLAPLAVTFATTLAVFAIYLGQGILVARLLGPLGRGEYGHALYLPRDLLLYVGLLGGIEIVNRYAAAGQVPEFELKRAAARLGLVSGVMTAVGAAILSAILLWGVGKFYLFPFCLVCCGFLPWEHIHLVVSGVDRGARNYWRYNLNRLLFAFAFPIFVVVGFGLGWQRWIPGANAELWLMCGLLVVSKFVGLLPTLSGMDVKGWLLERTRGPKIQRGAAEEHHGPGVRQLLTEGRPYAFSMLASELFERLDLLLIVVFASVEMSGHYFVAVPAAALLIIAPNALGVFTFNAGADPHRRVTKREAVLVMSWTAALQVVSTILFWIFLPSLIVWVYGERFSEAIPFAIALAPACAIKGYLQAVDAYLKGRGRPLVGVASRLVSIIVMLGVFAATWPRWGLLSIPWSAVAGQAVSMLILSYVAYRVSDSADRGRLEPEGVPS